MDTPTEKDYVDARLQAILERVSGETKAHQISTDARLDKLEQTLREESNTKYAQLEANFHRGISEVIKWTVGVVLASTAISVSAIAVLLLHAMPKPTMQPTPTPIVIYPQPAPPTIATPTK
jgi:hypothetical protein